MRSFYWKSFDVQIVSQLAIVIKFDIFIDFIVSTVFQVEVELPNTGKTLTCSNFNSIFFECDYDDIKPFFQQRN